MQLATGHSQNKHRTNVPPHRLKWKEVCSASHTRTEILTSGSGRVKKICEKNEVVLGREYQPPQRRPMDLVCHYAETVWHEKTRETSQMMERRPGQILERHELAEDSTREANWETACWGLHPTSNPMAAQWWWWWKGKYQWDPPFRNWPVIMPHWLPFQQVLIPPDMFH